MRCESLSLQRSKRVHGWGRLKTAVLRTSWRRLGQSYVQQWTYDDDDYNYTETALAANLTSSFLECTIIQHDSVTGLALYFI